MKTHKKGSSSDYRNMDRKSMIALISTFIAFVVVYFAVYLV